jgi:hypothetical protein
VVAHEDPESINWPEFKAAFRAHHVPQGIIKLKKKEFEKPSGQFLGLIVMSH